MRRDFKPLWPQEPAWPPGKEVSDVLDQACWRYRDLGPQGRPPLDQPNNAVGLFTEAELHTLAFYGYWPLPRRAQVWMKAMAGKTAARMKGVG